VLRARTLKGMDQPTLGGLLKPEVTNLLISKIEKGRKSTLSARTVGRFIIALDLDESWIDKFLDVEETEDGGETKAEREADQVIDRLRQEGATEGAGDDLLIQLANNFTEGEHKDRETAYRSVRAALAELAANKDIAAMAGNADAQFAALIREVDRLNNEGDFDEAARRLDDEQDRQEQVAELHHKKQLSQDRLRNRPDLAAERIIKNLRQFPQGGKLFWAIDDKADEWREQGDKSGDLFGLRVGLVITKANYETYKNKSALAAAALRTLGWCHLRLAERSTNDRHLKVARTAFEAAVQKTSKAREPLN
jgi:hypothetical protein